MMFRFTIRDVLWLTVVVALIVGATLRNARQVASLAAEQRAHEVTMRQRNRVIDFMNDRQYRVEFTDEYLIVRHTNLYQEKRLDFDWKSTYP